MVMDICGAIPYTDKNGEQKRRWIKVGSLIKAQKGGLYVFFEKHINPAGFADEKGEVWFSVFDQKPKEENIFKG